MLPSREEISSAYQAAMQSRAPAPGAAPLSAIAPITVVPPATNAAPQGRKIDAEELANLMQRAKGFLAAGDLMSARLLLERAADAEAVDATLLLAQTYDPDVLGSADVRNVV